jgi:hypothetical protein
MADELFSRLSAIGGIIGGGTGVLDLPSFDEPEEIHVEEDGHDHGAPAPTTGFTGGTMTEARKASGGPTPGATALMNHLLGRFTDSTRNGGIYANRNVRGGTSLSVHAEGRAGDVMVPVVGGGHASGNAIAKYLETNADRFGIQRLIWNGRSWNRRTRTWVAYNGQNPHKDHVHWEITPEAAARPDLYSGAGAAAGGIGSAIATDTDDLFSRVKAIGDIVGGKSAQAAKAGRTAAGKRDFSADMAATFARARAGSGQSRPGASATGAVTGDKASYQSYAFSRFSDFGWGAEEQAALVELWNKESGWNPAADNPTSTAYGIAQFLDGTWAGTGIGRTSDPKKQIDAGLIYIRNRYGRPSAALAFHRQKNWY